jgi:hypothetical protein
LKEHIVEIKKFIPPHICKKIISYFDKDYYDALTTGGNNKNVRNCITRSVLETSTFGEKITSNYIQKKFFEACEKYKSIYSYFSFTKLSQLDILKYEKNEYSAGYKYHCDIGFPVCERHLSISICLNNNFEGGEFQFDLNGEIVQYPQNIGDLIMFPSNFLFPHQVNKITEGTRYALIGWAI